MSVSIQLNSRMPYMPFNWSSHAARTARLTLEERGFFEVVRCELWTVVRCRMPMEMLLTRLRLTAKSKHKKLLDSLVALGLIQVDAEGFVYDEVQVREFDQAARSHDTKVANGKKGGRPKVHGGDQAAPSDPNEF